MSENELKKKKIETEQTGKVFKIWFIELAVKSIWYVIELLYLAIFIHHGECKYDRVYSIDPEKCVFIVALIS
jgi:hypothetical protein